MARVSLLVVLITILASPVSADALLPRRPLTKSQAVREPAHDHQLVVKFRDHLQVRRDAAGLLSRTGADLEPLHALQRKHGVVYRSLIQLPDETLDRLQQRAAALSGIAQPDLAGLFVAEADRLQDVADDLLALELTEFVHFQELTPPPPCTDIAPATPGYTNRQDYRESDPGLNMDAAWAAGAARGLGIKVADCEYGYNLTHEDLCGVTLEPGQTIAPDVVALGWDEHGTAVLGEMVSVDNAYGCLGMVPDADAYFFTEWSAQQGPRRATAVTNAIASVGAGDVVVLEMQTTGAGGGFGPAELDPVIWTITKTGSDAGVIVVAAAGNGNQDLDSAPYAEYRDRGDSGAIIVGAGTDTSSHNRLSFSTYGARVDLQGWGTGVFTLGYGDWAQHGGDKDQRYTAGFEGTSSATALVASAVIAVQSYVEDKFGFRLDTSEMRDLLISTGVPQGSGGHIGPLPDVAAAIGALGPSNDDCAEAPLAVAGADLSFTTQGATTDGFAESLCGLSSGSIDSDVWYRHFAPCDGVLTLTLTNLDYDARLAVYPSVDCPTGPDEAIACLDSTQASSIDVPVAAGQALRIRVGGIAGGQGDGTLMIECTPDGGCAEDCALPSDGAVDVTDLLEMLGQWGDAGSCDTTGDPGVDVTDLLALLSAWGADCRSFA